MNEEQKKAVADWFAAGASLDEIQKRIKAEFGIHLTYLDVRLLVAELPQPQEVVPEPPPEPQDGGTPSRTGPEEAGAASSDEAASVPSAEDAAGPDETAVGPQVTIDALMIPGTLASGGVTFSDGKTGKWYLDQMGRLGLGGDLPEGYRPSPTDAALFQQRLMDVLHSKGLC